tara:strand:+ start:395 stop:703 length:309 start_codon:yes stop_codon:yes gene_type:complete
MIIKGSLNYDSHGRRRKTVRTKRKSHKSKWTKVGAVAQQGEHRICTAKVAGSIPVSSTNAGKGTKPDNSWKVEISKQYTIAPAYNKGAYQVIPRKEVKDIGK